MEVEFVALLIVGGVSGALAYHLFVRKKFANNEQALKQSQTIEIQKAALEKELEFLTTRENQFSQLYEKEREQNSLLTKENSQLRTKLGVNEANIQNLTQQLTKQKEELINLQDRFTKEFKLIANEIINNNSKELSLRHNKELNEVLTPLKEKIALFQTDIEKKYIDETKERSSLKQEIKQLLEINKTLNEQAESLTSALKGDNKIQGNWGEIVLERILESSGLVEGKEFQKQFSDVNHQDKKIQPDIIVWLPEDKHVIIDSKVSLVAYEKFINEDKEESRNQYLKQHILSLKNHVKQLSEKNYQTGKKINSPDFVLLFLPIEPSFTLAAQYDPQLFSYSWERKVIIVSPTTLLATLRTIASVWKNERKFENAMQISENAAKLYDKFKGFIDDMIKIEKGLITAQNSYDEAFSKLSSGKGNLISRAEKFKNLGVTPTKTLPKTLTNNNNE